VLTELKAYSAWQSAPLLPLAEFGRAETDLVQIRDIQGLEPVKASVNISPFGSIDGAAYVGSSVLSRNIVLTIHPNPDWQEWTYESLRRLLYSYFMPKQRTRLVFNSDDLVPVEISGYVESADIAQFSEDPEFIVSVICPDPYFSAVDPVIITGESCLPSAVLMENLDYIGSVPAGIHVKLTKSTDPAPTTIGIQVGDPALSYFEVVGSISSTKYFEMSSTPANKFVQNVATDTGIITNLLSKATIREGSQWPVLVPGVNEFCVITDGGEHDWTLTYYARFGGL
jgi:Phage tail protein RIFT-related domain